MRNDLSEPRRDLAFPALFSIVVGTVIGGAVFIKAATMSQQLGEAKSVVAAWMAAGILSLAGALTYAELGAMLPRSGGDYVYIRTAYGELPAFLYGWTQVAITQTGSIAILGTTFAVFFTSLLPTSGTSISYTFHLKHEITWQLGSQQMIAVGVILLLSVINCLGVSLGGSVQTLLTIAKILGAFVVILAILLFSRGGSWSHLGFASAERWTGFSAFGSAMILALWAYDGWNCGAMIAGEAQHPSRNIPRALITGLLCVIVIYVALNLTFFYALPFNEIAASNSDAHPDAAPVAVNAVRTFLGPAGVSFISLLLILTTIGSLNGAILATARIPFAMSRDGLFFSPVGNLSHTTRSPVWALSLQALWASVLALSGTFDKLIDFVVFSLWIFYALTTASVFILRRKLPEAKRDYKTTGYPVVPLIFVLCSAWLLINTLITSPIESLKGLGLIACGLPLYFYFHKRQCEKLQKTAVAQMPRSTLIK
jgi:APA family basic amino acid/polyamine antiporter